VLERGARVLLQREQSGLLNSHRSRDLLAAALQKLAPEKPLAVDVMNFGADITPSSPSG
jgi:hypothetical protein